VSDPRVTLYSRPGCHLCEEARAVVARVCSELGESYAEVMIDGDPDLERRFGHEVPVTFVDGK
jgi:glutaredoxin